jgi:hypothetical protein
MIVDSKLIYIYIYSGGGILTINKYINSGIFAVSSVSIMGLADARYVCSGLRSSNKNGKLKSLRKFTSALTLRH